MNASPLSTQIHRAVFALPLLAVALAAAFGADALPEPPEAAPAQATATLPGDAAAENLLVANLDCESALRPAGAVGLARMPGDIGALGRRLRCAQ